MADRVAGSVPDWRCEPFLARVETRTAPTLSNEAQPPTVGMAELETRNTSLAVVGFVALRDIDAPAFEQSFQSGNFLVGAVDPVAQSKPE